MHALIEQLQQDEPLTFTQGVQHFSDRCPMLLDLQHTEQDPIWHAEGNVAIHMSMVIDATETLLEESSIKRTDEQRLALRLAALFHDIAKPVTTRTEEKDGRMCVLAPKHAKRGRSYLAYRLASLLQPTTYLEVLQLVAHHHAPIQLPIRNKQAPAYHKIARKVDTRSLYMLSMADMLGRTCDDQQTQIDYVHFFQLECENYGYWEPYNPQKDWSGLLEQLTAYPIITQERILMESIWEYERGLYFHPEEAIARSYDKQKECAEVYIMCGPSGSGKSTWIEANHKGKKIISLDRLRELHTGKRADQKHNAHVLHDARESFKQCLRDKQAVIWDATNLRFDFRNVLFDIARQYGAHVTLVVACPRLKTLHKRNKKRTHPIKRSALDRQINSFQWPDLDEAHRMIFIDEKGECLDDTRTRFFPHQAKAPTK